MQSNEKVIKSIEIEHANKTPTKVCKQMKEEASEQSYCLLKWQWIDGHQLYGSFEEKKYATILKRFYDHFACHLFNVAGARTNHAF